MLGRRGASLLGFDSKPLCDASFWILRLTSENVISDGCAKDGSSVFTF